MAGRTSGAAAVPCLCGSKSEPQFLGHPMKPLDFYIGARQWFGFVVPGAVWLAAAILLFTNPGLSWYLNRMRDARVIEILVFFGIATVVGMLMHRISYSVAKRSLNFRILGKSDWTLRRRICRLFSESLYALEGRCPRRRAAVEHRRGTNDRCRSAWNACKHVVLIDAPVLGHKLLESEHEINLLVGLPLPVSLLACALCLRADELKSVGVGLAAWDGPSTAPLWLCRGAIVGLTVLLWWRSIAKYAALRRHEVIDSFEYFLIVQDLSEAKRGRRQVRRRLKQRAPVVGEAEE